jgi:hypothetical protein
MASACVRETAQESAEAEGGYLSHYTLKYYPVQLNNVLSRVIKFVTALDKTLRFFKNTDIIKNKLCFREV